MRNVLAVTALALVAVAAPAVAGDLPPISKDSGFAWLDGVETVPHEVERERVKKGMRAKGHPRDVIKPIDEPKYYETAKKAEKGLGLTDDDRILGIAIGDDARAYPTRILDRHEVVNDTIGGRPLAVVW